MDRPALDHRDENIGLLDVTVDDPSLVRELQGVADWDEEYERTRAPTLL